MLSPKRKCEEILGFKVGILEVYERKSALLDKECLNVKPGGLWGEAMVNAETQSRVFCAN